MQRFCRFYLPGWLVTRADHFGPGGSPLIIWYLVRAPVGKQPWGNSTSYDTYCTYCGVEAPPPRSKILHATTLTVLYLFIFVLFVT